MKPPTTATIPGISWVSHCFAVNCQLVSLKKPKLKSGPTSAAAITQPPSRAIRKPNGIALGVQVVDRRRATVSVMRRFRKSKRCSVVLMPRGYMEGPAAEEAERRLEELERGADEASDERRLAVIGSTDDEPEPHFLGWRDDVDPDELFARGRAWGLKVVRRAQ